MAKRVLITGAGGMLARTLIGHWSGRHSVIGVRRDELDVVDPQKCVAVLADINPDIVIHCAAYTAVDRCETDCDQAFAVNAIGSANIASCCHRIGARLIAISTDYVFPGELQRPYHEWDETGPRTTYGRSKLAGETAIRAHCPNHAIARVAWLYGAGGPSFVHTILKLGAHGGDPLRVVNDQIGNPTSALAVAKGIDAIIDRGLVGTIHLTCSGEATWYDFASEVLKLSGSTRGISPCSTNEYPRPAPRPANSRLENRVLRIHGLTTPAWQDALAEFLHDHPQS